MENGIALGPDFVRIQPPSDRAHAGWRIDPETCMNKKRPNILLIMTDQQRGDALGVAGRPHEALVPGVLQNDPAG